ncbi:MAG: TetR/AcrR family transcriptional regulator [Pseudomonadota bacterium]
MNRPVANTRKKPRLSREQQKAARMQDLLAAASVMFREKGYDAVTIDQVAEYAGCSRMPVYTLFGDRQNLFFELWRSVTADLEQGLFKHFVPGTSLRRNLKQLAELLSDSFDSEKPAYDSERLFFVMQTISLSRPDIAEKLSDLTRKIIKDVARCIEQSSLARGEKLRSDADTVASHLLAYINGMATAQFQTKTRFAKAKDLIPIFNAMVFKDV